MFSEVTSAFTHAGNIGQAAFIPETSRYERYVISQRQFYMRCDLSMLARLSSRSTSLASEGRHRLLRQRIIVGRAAIARAVTYLRTIPLTIPTRPVSDAFEGLVSPILQEFLKNPRELSGRSLPARHAAAEAHLRRAAGGAGREDRPGAVV